MPKVFTKNGSSLPRTDSDFDGGYGGIFRGLWQIRAGVCVEEPFPIHVQQVINGSKVNDHHALLPTKSMAKADLAASLPGSGISCG